MTATAICRGGPRNNLIMAIGLLQAHFLASDSNLEADALFGANHMPQIPVELALALLVPLLSEVDEEWQGQPGEDAA